MAIQANVSNDEVELQPLKSYRMAKRDGERRSNGLGGRKRRGEKETDRVRVREKEKTQKLERNSD